MRRAILLLSGLMALLSIAVPAALVWYGAYTESGLRFIARHVPERIGRVELRIGAVSGALARGVHIERFELEHERVHLRFENVRGRISLAPLLLQTLRAPQLRIGRALVEIRRRREPVPKYEPRFLPRWLHVRVDRLEVAAATLVMPGGRRFDGTRLHASGTAAHKSIRLFDAAFALDALQVAGLGTLRATDPMELDLQARLDWRIPGQPPWTIAASASGNLDELGLDGHFSSPFRADFAARALALTGNWRWSGRAKVRDLDLRTWGGGAVLGRITGELALTGDAQGFAARGPLTPEGLRAGAFDTAFRGSYADRTLTAAHIELVHRASGARVAGAGEIGIVADGPRLALAGSWSRFRWPLVGEEVGIRSAAGEYSLHGVWPYELRASGEIAIPRAGPMPVEIEGRLAKDRLSIGSGEVAALGGRASLAGEVVWSPEDSWSASGRATDLDPARIRADLPGRLSFAFDASGEGFDQRSDFSVRVNNIAGRLRGVRASGRGQVARVGTAWDFEDVQLGLGRSALSLDGRIAKQLDLRFALQTEDLDILAAESRGRLRARGTIRGTVKEPVVDATANGSGIRHAGLSIESFDAVVDFDALMRRPSRIDVQARKLEYAERRVERAEFTLDGTAGEHVARLDARALGLTVEARAAGGYGNGTWSGELRELRLNGTEALRLGLERPVALLLSAERAHIDPFCLQGKPARLCGDARWTPAQWSSSFTASDLPMSTLTAGLTPGIEYRGSIDVEARASASMDEPVHATLRAELTEAQLAHRRPNGRIEVITLGAGTVTADADTGGIRAAVDFDARHIGRVTGNLAARRAGAEADWRQMPLQGELRLQTAELGFITLYVPQVDRTAGRLAADLTVAGTVGRPLVDGIVKLSDAELDVYQVNLAMREVGLEARLLDSGLDFNGSARIGQGSVRARGLITWRAGQPSGRLNIEGSNLRVVDIPEAEIDASPDLDFSIDGRRIRVTGSVKVPYAHIEPVELTGAVRTSSDEVIVGEEPRDPAQRFKVESEIRLALGERVSIDTYGLTGRLTGSLTVRSGYDEVTRGAGELDILEAKYTAYGRRLDVERGRLVFTGGPINNPGVDIRAVKRFPDVVAGVNVRGTLLQPRLTFFSEPSLPQSQVVSLILAGGSLASVQNGANGNGTQSAAGNELLAQGGAILAQQLGARIGIEDVSIEQNLDNETSLVLGKYLSPRFYVSYGISLTETLNTLKMRYTLDDHWTIRTEVGEDRSADLVYTFER